MARFIPNKRKKKRRQDVVRARGPRVAMEELDYKNVHTLQRLTSAQGKMFSRKRSGLNAPAQRKAVRQVKYARFLALLPYVS